MRRCTLMENVCIRFLVVLIGAVQLSQCGCNSKSKADLAIEEVQTEIKTLFDRFKQAVKKDDLEELFDTSSRESVKRMIFEAIVAMGSNARSAESDKILNTYINKQKLEQIGAALKNPNEQQTMELYMVCIDKPREMFLESYRYLRKLQPVQTTPEFGELTDIKVTGDVAIGKTKVGAQSPAGPPDKSATGSERNEPTDISIYFIRVDGQWKYASEAEWAGMVPK